MRAPWMPLMTILRRDKMKQKQFTDLFSEFFETKQPSKEIKELIEASVLLLERIEVLECDLTMDNGDKIDPIEFLRDEFEALNRALETMSQK